MTKKEIIKLAKQAGFERLGHDDCDYVCYPDEIEAFAKLVAEKVNADWSETNERLIKVFNEKADLAYLSGAKEEREACAKVCDVLAVHPEYASSITKLAAQAIRNRGQA